MSGVLIVGATSAIAEQVARRYAARGARLALWGRDAARLAAIAADLGVRGAAAVEQAVVDLEADDLPARLAALAARCEGLELVLVAHGNLPDQAACEADFGAVRKAFAVNALSAMAVAEAAATCLAQQGHGTLAVISSVAGDRGRASNYVYGAAKGALTRYLQGLRNRLAAAGVHVLTIKPGFVDTPMTAHLPKGALWATPERVADDIVRAIERRREVLYTPWFWRWVMAVLCAIPEGLFKRTRL
ncbi:MAG: SDR family oxidoreductase [Gammaproteobacteria bacterium]|nr:SDR family oxidoreductase [Gammaproteobacteria bacterium]